MLLNMIQRANSASESSLELRQPLILTAYNFKQTTP